MPRVGGDRGTLWINRDSIEVRFENALKSEGIHLCLDGPSGSGKTSLALTVLARNKWKFTTVQVSKNLNWAGLCKQIVEEPHTSQSTVSAEFNVGLSNALPQGNIKLTVGKIHKDLEDFDLWEKKVSSLTEHDLCRALAQSNSSLLIDDFERADKDLIVRIADLCKILTQSFTAPQAKLIIIGTSNIYKELYEAYPNLEGRLEHISLGGLPSPKASWEYLSLGLEKIGLWSKQSYGSRDYTANLDCANAVTQAVGCQLKPITELGRNVCTNCSDRQSFDIRKIIIQESEKLPLRNFRMYRNKFPRLFKEIKKNSCMRFVFEYLFEEGVEQIHDWDDMEERLGDPVRYGNLEGAILSLVDMGLLTQTGRNGEVLYVQDTNLAHTLGLALQYPDKFRLSKEAFDDNGQVMFSFRYKEK
jgi:hypothetical protein